jgi:hypothetical protein
LPTDITWEKLLPVGLKSVLARWKQPFVPWGRRSLHWAAPTHDSKPRENLIYASHDSCPRTKNVTHLQLGLNPSPSPS